MLVLKMGSVATGAALSVPVGYRKNTVSAFNAIANNLGSFAEIVKEVALLF